jgi:hypothetical protein
MKLFGVSIKNKVATTIYVAMIIFLLALTIVL